MPSATIPPPAIEQLLVPLLASLPTAAVSPSPPTALLPILSPILRQRVQLLSQGSSDPWLPLLCYDTTKASKLKEIVQSSRLEPHPVSGEIEIDWDSDVEVTYKRVDEETLHAYLDLSNLELTARCVWCVGDQEGGGDGWRIGEVNIVGGFGDAQGGAKTISEAEESFKAGSKSDGYLIIHNGDKEAEEEEEDDDDYWAQYDNTPARTPAPHHRSPAPEVQNGRPAGDEESYYAQYASVQPAMDNHDPDEEVPEGIETSLGERQEEPPQVSAAELEHPRPGSSSSGEDTVARLEREAAKELESREELGIKQHIGTSIKSLYRLAKVAGIERAEFERLVSTELECLGMMDEDD